MGTYRFILDWIVIMFVRSVLVVKLPPNDGLLRLKVPGLLYQTTHYSVCTIFKSGLL